MFANDSACGFHLVNQQQVYAESANQVRAFLQEHAAPERKERNRIPQSGQPLESPEMREMVVVPAIGELLFADCLIFKSSSTNSIFQI